MPGFGQAFFFKHNFIKFSNNLRNTEGCQQIEIDSNCIIENLLLEKHHPTFKERCDEKMGRN